MLWLTITGEPRQSDTTLLTGMGDATASGNYKGSISLDNGHMGLYDAYIYVMGNLTLANDSLLTINNNDKNSYAEFYIYNDDALGDNQKVSIADSAISMHGYRALMAFSGAVDAAIQANQASVDAINARLGVGGSVVDLTASKSKTGAGIWLAPVYRSHDGDGFDAQGVDFGTDLDLYGVTLGADYTMEDQGMRFGAMFNVGSGEADGQGAASNVSNDFDYWGLGLYFGAQVLDNGLITADLGYSQVSNELDATINAGGYDSVSADADSTALTLGVTGEFTFETHFVDIAPHASLRWTQIDLDSYSVDGKNSTIADADSDKMNLFSIPVGVSFAKTLKNGDWMVRPEADVTIAANFGDTEFDSDVTFVGADNVALSSEVVDDFTYGVSLGLNVTYDDNLNFDLKAGYTGSENADDVAVNANVSYTF